MAQKVVTTFTDDLTGEESDEISTHTILVDGAGVEIDLTPDSHDKLMDALRPFLSAQGARRVRGGASSSAATKTRRRPAGAAGGQDTSAIRAWAKSAGLEVNDRGRVPASIREAYEKAN
ncbi:Lsr2 family protein [Streptomyces sp. NPDC046215]